VVLKHWITSQFQDFDIGLVQKLATFINDTLRKDGKEMAEMSTRLSTELNNKNNERKKKRESLTATPFFADILPFHNSPLALFLNFDELEVAKQFTINDFTIFKKVKAPELLNQAWNKPKLQYKSPHILALIEKINRNSFWVASVILWHSKLSDRVKMIEKYIRIAEHLHNISNFNTLIAVIAGLNISAVNRMKHTWDQVNKKQRESLAKMQEVFSPSNSFKLYRNTIRVATSKGAVMPYLGVVLGDLTFAEDGNTDYLDNNPNLCNFRKREIICKIIRELLLNQQTAYNFPVDEAIRAYVTEVPYVEDRDLYDLSLQREPRNVPLSKLEQ